MTTYVSVPAEQFCTSLVDRKQRQPCITRHGELMEEMEESLGLRPIPSEDLFFFLLENAKTLTFGYSLERRGMKVSRLNIEYFKVA